MCKGEYFEATSSKIPLWKAIAFAGGLVPGIYSDPLYAAPSNSDDTVQALHDALLSTIRNGRALGQSGRFTQLAPVRRSFDVAAMARLSVDPSWARLIDAQRQQMTELGRHIAAICADRFDSYAGQKLEVTGQQPSASGVMVKCQITKAKLRPFNLKWIGKIAVPQGARLGLEPRADVIHNYRLT